MNNAQFLEEHKQLSEAFLAFVRDYAFLFEKSKQFIPISDYVEWLKESGINYNAYSIPTGYELDCLNQYKDNIVCTSYFFTGAGARQYYSIIQLDPENHILVYYTFDECKDGRFIANFDFMVMDNSVFLNFMKENQKFSITNEVKMPTFGFLPQ